MMYGYTRMSEYKVDESDIPQLTQKEKGGIENLFKKYIFYHREKSTRYITTSCCHQQKAISIARSHSQKKKTKHDIDESFVRAGKHNEKGKCPYCGQVVQLKNEGKIKGRRNLLEFVPVLVLKKGKGNDDLKGLAFWAYKDYECNLDPEVELREIVAYSFRLGEARARIKERDGSYTVVEKGNINTSARNIKEPFTKQGYWSFVQYMDYHIIGLENIYRTSMRYCQYEEYARAHNIYEGEKHKKALTYLATYSVYPSVEMLARMGIYQILDDAIYDRRKNSDIIKWGEPNPMKAFNLTREELKEFLSHKSINWLKQLKHAKKHEVTFDDFEEIYRAFRTNSKGMVEAFISMSEVMNIKPVKLARYLKKFEGPRCHGTVVYFDEVFRRWKDYIDAARRLNYDLDSEVIKMPRELMYAHDRATGEVQRQLELEKQKLKEEKEKAFAEILEKWQNKYEFEFNGLRTIVAKNTAEIVAEGGSLKHCVGGYASRHIEGKLTIIFLRHIEEPETSYVTIEMQKNTLIQAHGFRNEMDGQESPQKKHKDFFEAWQEWIERGSKRDKNGNPILKKNNKKKAKAA